MPLSSSSFSTIVHHHSAPPSRSALHVLNISSSGFRNWRSRPVDQLIVPSFSHSSKQALARQTAPRSFIKFPHISERAKLRGVWQHLIIFGNQLNDDDPIYACKLQLRGITHNFDAKGQEDSFVRSFPLFLSIYTFLFRSLVGSSEVALSAALTHARSHAHTHANTDLQFKKRDTNRERKNERKNANIRKLTGMMMMMIIDYVTLPHSLGLPGPAIFRSLKW